MLCKDYISFTDISTKDTDVCIVLFVPVANKMLPLISESETAYLHSLELIQINSSC